LDILRSVRKILDTILFVLGGPYLLRLYLPVGECPRLAQLACFHLGFDKTLEFTIEHIQRHVLLSWAFPPFDDRSQAYSMVPISMLSCQVS
jgi:hypothetical protein